MRHMGAFVVVLAIGAGKAEAGPLQSLNLPVEDQAPTLDFKAWEQAMDKVKNVRVDIELTRTDAVFKKERKYKGVLLFMKPNFMILRLDNLGDPTRNDYEAYICNGKSLYSYNGLEKIVTEWKLPSPSAPPCGQDKLSQFLWAVENSGYFAAALGLKLSGTNPRYLKENFDIKLFKQNKEYLYLGLKPNRNSQEVAHELKLALFGPNTKLAYLPAELFVTNPNGGTDDWKITNPVTNLPGMDEKVFKYREVPGFKLRAGKIPVETEPVPASPTTDPIPTEVAAPPACYPTVVQCPSRPRLCILQRNRWRRLGY